MMLARLWAPALALGATISSASVVPAHHHHHDSPPVNDEEVLRASNATAFAVTYGYPLAHYAHAVDPVISSVGTNAIFHQRNLITADDDDEGVVRPNVDTLYSLVAVDLSTSNVVLTIPKIPDDRFFVIAFYDLWSNNYANLGRLTTATPGKYLLRIADQPWQIGFEEAEEGDPDYVGYINCATLYSLVLSRIVVRNEATDLKLAREAQDGIKITALLRPGPRLGPKLTTELLGRRALEKLVSKPAGSLPSHEIRDLLEALARVEPFNRPADPVEGALVTKTFEDAGLAYGKYDAPHEVVNHDLVNKLVSEGLQAAEKLLEPLNNGWYQLPWQSSGDFRNQYSVRALVAFSGYLQLLQSVALYPAWMGGNKEGLRGLSLKDDESYLVMFPSGKPPVKGFWSLTVYDDEGYLVPNSLNRYSLGDRSSLAYSNGELVYGKSNRTDAFSILIQSKDVRPPANWTSNWLPAPSEGEKFSITLRIFGPTEPLLPGGSYLYPTVSKQPAVRG